MGPTYAVQIISAFNILAARTPADCMYIATHQVVGRDFSENIPTVQGDPYGRGKGYVDI